MLQIKLPIFLGSIALLLMSADNHKKTPEEAFTRIYENREWGVNEDGGRSGSGASLATTVEYRSFLQYFLKEKNIQSVVDVGCGDWVWSNVIDWIGINYVGFDVVKEVIDDNLKNYSSENIHFVHADALTTDLPKADLLLCKDVLQHLPIEDVFSLMSQFYKYKYCIIQNDIDYVMGDNSNQNKQIERGEGRTLDLTQAPFFLGICYSLTYQEKNSLNRKNLIVVCNYND